MQKKEGIALIIGIVFLIIFLLIMYKNNKIDSDYNFKIYFFNAGKADAILVSKNNQYLLIDTGEESLKEELLDYFKKNNITKLEYLIITHFDRDHVGSASSIIDNIEVKEVLQSNYPKDSIYYSKYIDSLNNKNITPMTVSGNYDISLDDINILINGPEEVYEKNESNNSSIIISIINGNNKFLFMGDSENARIKDFVNMNNTTYDFIKMPYHGRYLKRLDNLLESTKPKYAVMTCSSKEGCEKETINVLNKYNTTYYMTKNGPISIYSNGDKIQIKK